MAKMQVRRVGIFSYAKISAVIASAFGLIFGLIYGLIVIVLGAAILAGGGRDTGAAGGGGHLPRGGLNGGGPGFLRGLRLFFCGPLGARFKNPAGVLRR